MHPSVTTFTQYAVVTTVLATYAAGPMHVMLILSHCQYDKYKSCLCAFKYLGTCAFCLLCSDWLWSLCDPDLRCFQHLSVAVGNLW